MRCLLLVTTIFAFSTVALPQSNQPDSQTLRALLEEVRLLRQDLKSTTVTAQRVQIALYQLQLQDAAVGRATSRVEAAHSKLTELAALHKNQIEVTGQIEHQRDQTQDIQQRKQMEEEVLPQLKKSVERVAFEEEQQQARTGEAEGQLRAEQAKLDALRSLLDQLDHALENVGHRPE
jgi:chromosome segregation ATPase